MSAAPPLIYVVLDKNGNNILNSSNAPKDSITLSYNLNGVQMQFCDSVYNHGLNKYNKMVAWDYKMLLLSTGNVSPNPSQTITPVHTFNMLYHGNLLGTIYFEYLGWENTINASWQQAKVFTFNNIPVKLDSTGGTHIYVIQLP